MHLPQDDPKPDPRFLGPAAPLMPLGPEHRSTRFEADTTFRPAPRAIPIQAAQPRENWLGVVFREFFGRELLTARASSWLVFLSLADLLMTYILLQRHELAYEANPVARWWFARWNIAGMTAFKFLVIACVILLCEFVERQRPRLGQVVLWFGCAGAAAMLVQGLRLYSHNVVPLGF